MGAFSPEAVYSRKDVKDLISFARDRAVAIVIEIDVPEKKSGNPQFDGNGNQSPMNEIILRFDKMAHGRPKTEKRAVKDSGGAEKKGEGRVVPATG